MQPGLNLNYRFVCLSLLTNKQGSLLERQEHGVKGNQLVKNIFLILLLGWEIMSRSVASVGLELMILLSLPADC